MMMPLSRPTTSTTATEPQLSQTVVFPVIPSPGGQAQEDVFWRCQDVFFGVPVPLGGLCERPLGSAPLALPSVLAFALFEGGREIRGLWVHELADARRYQALWGDVARDARSGGCWGGCCYCVVIVVVVVINEGSCHGERHGKRLHEQADLWMMMLASGSGMEALVCPTMNAADYVDELGRGEERIASRRGQVGGEKRPSLEKAGGRKNPGAA